MRNLHAAARAYLEIFDDCFFFGNLKDICTISFGDLGPTVLAYCMDETRNRETYCNIGVRAAFTCLRCLLAYMTLLLLRGSLNSNTTTSSAQSGRCTNLTATSSHRSHPTPRLMHCWRDALLHLARIVPVPGTEPRYDPLPIQFHICVDPMMLRTLASYSLIQLRSRADVAWYYTIPCLREAPEVWFPLLSATLLLGRLYPVLHEW